MHVHDNRTKTGGFVKAADDGEAFWFLNTLTINKVRSDDTKGQLSIVDYRVPAGFAPPPHIHQVSDARHCWRSCFLMTRGYWLVTAAASR
jgi:hypothetical protein